MWCGSLARAPALLLIPHLRAMLRALPLLLMPAFAQAAEYVVPAGDIGQFFATLPADATYLSFSASGDYSCSGDIVLPPGKLLVIDGRGCSLKLGPASNGFTCAVADQKDAMQR